MYFRNFPNIGLPPETVARMQERAGNHQAAARTRRAARGGAAVNSICLEPAPGSSLERHQKAGMRCPPLTHCMDWKACDCRGCRRQQREAVGGSGSTAIGLVVGIGAVLYLATAGGR